ncbi:MAG: integration host factor, actinobacterial type [Solirubrobacterales bacterium]
MSQPATKSPQAQSAPQEKFTAATTGPDSGDEPAAVTTPDRSPTQRLEALKLANAVRTERASLKRDLKAGRIRVEQVLGDPPECVHSAKVADIMLAVPRYGRVKVTKVLQRCRISPSKTVIGLSERQRVELIDALRRP